MTLLGRALLIPVGLFGMVSCFLFSAQFFNMATDGYDETTSPIIGNIIFTMGIGIGVTPPILLVRAIIDA